MAVLAFYEPYGKEGLEHSASVSFSQLKMTVAWLFFTFLHEGLLISRWKKKKSKPNQPLYDMSGLS